MGASITLAGESLVAQKLGAQERLDVVRFVFANVPGLDSGAPVDRAAAKPPAEQIVHRYTIPPQNIGFVNPNQVVYSSMLGSDIGDFDWNWMGLETAEDVLLAVAYMPLQQKRKNIPPLQLGNNVTRNVLVAFDGAQALTAITIDASTWQHDFTVRLAGIDERERRSNREMYGRACFFGDALALTHNGTAYQLNAGIAYLEGIRVQLDTPYHVATQIPVGEVYLDVCLGRELNDRVATWALQFGEREDYTDSAGVRHYCVPIAHFLTYTQITDRRVVEPIAGPVIQHLAARNGDYRHLRARATTKADVELDQIPNAISNDLNTDDPWILATTRMVQAVRKHLDSGINALVNGITAAGKAKQLETARRVSISGAGTGRVMFDGTADVDIPFTLADVVSPGAYTKVTVSAKGLVVGAEYLKPLDIPVLDWSAHIGSKPTTLDGYGITNALFVDKVSQQRPILSAPTPGFDWNTGALEIREATAGAVAGTTFDYAPRMIFHWSGLVAGDLALSIDGNLCWNGHKLWSAGSFDPNTKADKATTLESYGITNALIVDKVSQQRPTLAATTPGLEWSAGALEIRECGLVGGAQTGYDYAPKISFHWGGVYGGALGMASNGELHWNGQRLWTQANFEPTTVVPAGAIIAFCHGHVFDGYLRANGAAASRTGFARLFNLFGTHYGAGDGHSTFNLPDLRGEFIRGLDEGRGLDPGRVIGTHQNSQNLWHDHAASSDAQGEHTHGILKAASGNNTSGGYVSPANVGNTLAYSQPAGTHNHNITVHASGGNESRPPNIAMVYCIKY